MGKFVSIVLPTYNGSKFISESIESVINQTYQDWELIIVNDCSTDNTLEICREYEKKDSRIRVIDNEVNKKLPASLNVGFREAKGVYYTWTSDDNRYMPIAIERMVQELDDNSGIDMVSFAYENISDDGDFVFVSFADIDRTTKDLMTGCNIGACFMYRREIAEKVGEYDENTFCAEDYDYWCRLALVGNILYNKDVLYQYRLNSQSLTATKQKTVRKMSLGVKLKYAEANFNKFGFTEKEKTQYYLKLYELTGVISLFRYAFNHGKILTIKYILKKFIQTIFSIRNQYNNETKRKILTILGLKLKFKCKSGV